jgi:hypothetical protein
MINGILQNDVLKMVESISDKQKRLDYIIRLEKELRLSLAMLAGLKVLAS